MATDPTKPNPKGHWLKELLLDLTPVLGEIRSGRQAKLDFEEKIRSNTPHENIIDSHGNVRQINSAAAENSARQNGWRHHWRARGFRVKSGVDGRMDFRLLAGSWQPTGYKLERGERVPVSRRGVFYDPDGLMWKWIKGDWCRVL